MTQNDLHKMYDPLWEQFQTLKNSELPASALDQLDLIRKKTIAEKNDPQWVKSFLEGMELQCQLKENFLDTVILEFKIAMDSKKGITQAIMQCVLADFYWNYYQRNSWTINQRTPTATNESENRFALMTRKEFIQQINQLYQNAFPVLLNSNVAFPDWQPLFTTPSGLEANELSMMDVLCPRILQFQWQDLSTLYEINEDTWTYDPGILKSFHQWQSEKQVPSSEAGLKSTLENYSLCAQRWNQNPSKKSFLLFQEVNRLRFFYQLSNHSDKVQLYEKALLNLMQWMPAEKEIAGAQFELASLYESQQDGRFHSDQPKQHEFLAKAIKTFESIIQQNKSEYWTGKAKVSLDRIHAPVSDIICNDVNIPGRKPLVQIAFKNVKKCWIHAIDLKKYPQLENIEIEKLKMLLQNENITVTSSLKIELPQFSDHLIRTAECLLPTQPSGRYLYICSDQESIKNIGSQFSYKVIGFTNIYMVLSTFPGKNIITCVDRTTGKPLKNAKLELLGNRVNNNNYEDYTVQGTTDSKGRYPITMSQVQSITCHYKNDSWKENYYVYSGPVEKPIRQNQYLILTDRSIYRPGQTVYYKVIAYQQTSENEQEIKKNLGLNIKLLDANGQEKASIQQKTNSYGSAHGSFLIEKGGLTGAWQIQCNDQGIQIQVEEYKRPAFKVTLEKPEQIAKNGSMITCKGIVETFSGARLGGTELIYTIQRESEIPWYCGWGYRGYWPQAESKRIAKGKLLSKEDGTFEIQFIAEPEVKFSTWKDQWNHFTINIDAKDVAGEVQSTSITVNSNNSGIDFRILNEEQEAWKKDLNLNIILQDINQNDIQLPVTITAKKLKVPERYYTERPWPASEIKLINQSEHEKNAPNISWKNEENPAHWQVIKETKVYTGELKGKKSIPLNNLLGGAYQIVVEVHTPTGLEKYEKFWKVYSTQDAVGIPLTHVLSKTEYDVNDIATVNTISGLKEAKVQSTVTRSFDLLIDKSNAANTLVWKKKIEPKDKGNLYCTSWTVWEGIFLTHTITIPVPHKDKSLELTWKSQRNITLPGSKERWSLTIKNQGKAVQAAELCATLYDASLDQILPHRFSELIWPQHAQLYNLQSSYVSWGSFIQDYRYFQDGTERSLPQLLSYMQTCMGYGRGIYPRAAVMDAVYKEEENAKSAPILTQSALADQASGGKQKETSPPPAKAIRKNLQELVFFKPELHTDAEGNLVLDFEINEALTTWKFLGFAHTPALQSGLIEGTVKTQKPLMIQGQLPRFLRQGDTITLAARVSNLDKIVQNTKAELKISDVLSNQALSYQLIESSGNLRLEPGQTQAVFWKILVPDQWIHPVQIECSVRSQNATDAELVTIPVLTNKVWVQETVPFYVDGNSKKAVQVPQIKKSSSTAQVLNVQLNCNPTPILTVIECIPYLIQYPHECSEQIMQKVFAYMVSDQVLKSVPEIELRFQQLRQSGKAQSALTSNKDLQNIALDNTPWVRDAIQQNMHWEHIADILQPKLREEQLNGFLQQLKQNQYSDGGFPWFKGGAPDAWVTLTVCRLFSILNTMKAIPAKHQQEVDAMMQSACNYLDQWMHTVYSRIESNVAIGKDKWENDHLDAMMIYYLFVRSEYQKFPVQESFQKEVQYFKGQCKKFWNGKGLQNQCMIALMHLTGDDRSLANSIIKSIAERATRNPEMGMYWKSNPAMYWDENALTTQSLIIELFSKSNQNIEMINACKTWLLQQKRTTHWNTTLNTAFAMHALMLQGTSWIKENNAPRITVQGNTKATEKIQQVQKDNPVGVIQVHWEGGDPDQPASPILIENKNEQVLWGGIFMDYLEVADQVKNYQTAPIRIDRKYFQQEKGKANNVLNPIDLRGLHVGDKVTMRIKLEVDRNMDYVHFSDMRPSGFEPVEVISTYRWRDGLGYYQSTRDDATHFYFDHLPKGSYILEYDCKVQHAGSYSSGISTLQCMYAPEFTAHSDGIKIRCGN